MSAQLLDGKAASNQIRAKIKQSIDGRIAQGLRQPGLAVVLIGNDHASEIYVRNKRNACEKAGIISKVYNLPLSTTEQHLLALINDLNEDVAIDGILVQLPLPEHIDAEKVMEKIKADKDVDGFHPYNLGRLAERRPLLRPCTPFGIVKLLMHYEIDLAGQHAVIVGASNIVGRPMSLEFLLAKCTTTVCHRFTKDLAKYVADADILVAAVGNPEIINSDWIRPGTIIVDVGINRHEDGSLRGDIDFATASQKASWITPVPGGVGPMTVTMLLHNTLYATEHLH